MDISLLAAQNIESTYIRLGSVIRGAEVLEGPGFRGVLSSFRHAVGNFAVCHILDRTSSFELWRIARDRPAFYVYASRFDADDQGALLLERGFARTHRLTQMVWTEGHLDSPYPIALLPLETADVREMAADFIARQFFSHQPPAVRDVLASINAHSLEMEIHGAWEPLSSKTYRNMLGALSLSFTEGCMGIYNLCVEPRYRSQGVGRAIVAKAVNVAVGKAQRVILQCDPPLMGWYEAQGFQSIGVVDVFAFGQP